MDENNFFPFVLALIWGLLVAVFIHKFKLGLYLRKELTWLAVVTGVGGVLGLAVLVVPAEWIGCVFWMFALAGAPIVVSCLVVKQEEMTEAEKKVVNKRLANNVIDSLEDIVALCRVARGVCMSGLKGEASAEDLVQIFSCITDVERKATGARNGEYWS